MSVLAGIFSIKAPAFAQDQRAEMRELRRQLDEMREELRRSNAEKERKIEALEQQVSRLQARPAPTEESRSPESALDRALSNLEQVQERAGAGDLYSRQVGSSTVRLMDISLDALFAAGGSSVGDEEIAVLEGGGHDPKRQGFTLQQVELGFQAAVDPYLTAEAYLVFHEEGVETEEAFFKTSSLPYGLQVKGGHYFTEFGILNQVHPHAWDWIDQPIINTRLFGGDGTRGPGVRLGWLTPLPWYSEVIFGVQNANDETMVSFLGGGHAEEEHGTDEPEPFETTIGGRPAVERDVSSPEDLLYSARWEHSFDLSGETTAKFGASGLFGPNNTGPDGYTFIYGADLKVKWRPVKNEAGWPFVLWQSEVMARDYEADGFFLDDGTDLVSLGSKTLHDWGFYTQLLYGFRPRWATGLRYEFASGSGASVIEFEGRADDPLRDNRHRFSPLLTWYPSEFSRFRLQYNYDVADHLAEEDVHSVWLGAEFLVGSHPAHKF